MFNKSKKRSSEAPRKRERANAQARRGKSRRSSGVLEGNRAKQKSEGFFRRTVNNWWNRLLTAVFSGKVSEQSEQYLSHQTTRDYVCNSIGQACWGGFFPLLTIVTTQLVGAENAGIFSMAMVIGTVLLFFGNYGVRTYQVSDIDEMESFYDYQVNRIITCVAMLIVGWLYCMIRGYDSQMTAIVMWVLGFRFFDALGDVYEGRLQQKDKLYLAGLSQAVRCALAFVAFTVLLLITHDLAVSSFAMTIGAAASFFLLTLPLALMETDKSLPFSVRGVKEIFVNCFPLFLAAFLYNLVDSMPKFAIEGVLSYDNQLYYNAMYFPAHAILMVAAMVYKPQLLRLASIWDDPQKHKRFDLIILAMIGVIAIITLLMGLVMAWIGIPIMSFLYGLDFEQFRPLVYVMVVNGGMCAGIDFLYQIITVLREQKVVSRIYLITFAFSIPVLYLLVSFSGLSGAVVGAVVVMGILLVLLLSEYFMIRKRLERY
ncbi:MAG: lipopolysaccharide biosynthesis protein [Tractidigestivibacter sp.]|uniref:lipopolysaccharide biosynthesis protein n=1 Tax=Tractidigestivibacter sp. TaxID=2847320 RepID=UPI003D8ED965